MLLKLQFNVTIDLTWSSPMLPNLKKKNHKNHLINLAPNSIIQFDCYPGQKKINERHFVFNISADFKISQSYLKYLFCIYMNVIRSREMGQMLAKFNLDFWILSTVTHKILHFIPNSILVDQKCGCRNISSSKTI